MLALVLPLNAAPKNAYMKPQYITITSLDSKGDDVKDIVSRADKVLKEGNITITTKEPTPPSGDKRDYVSMSPYWWPDPNTKDGLPYIRKDGQVNPERSNYTDNTTLFKVLASVNALGHAYHYTKDDKYAAKANDLVNTFFVDKKTKMNPNLNYGQFIPGHNVGRGAGIIETRNISRLLEGIVLLRGARSWQAKTDAGIKAWVKSYLTWLQDEPLGQKEVTSKNNHGTHYDSQCVAMYLFLNDTKGAKKFLEKHTLKRIAQQVKPDGSQPEELARTKSWDYCDMNLQGWVALAIMAEKVGLDLWNHQSEDGQIYMKSMFDWYEPYLNGSKDWQWKQIVRMRIETLRYAFAQASRAYKDEKYNKMIEKQVIVR